MFGMQNREQSSGDSGGPVFNGNTAYGLHEDGYNSGGGMWRDTKSQANYIMAVLEREVDGDRSRSTWFSSAEHV